MTKYLVLLITLTAASYGGALPGRIIGGETAGEHDFPYAVSLKLYGGHQCGAAILNDQWIITSARCVQGYPVNIMSASTGTSKLDSGGEQHQVNKYIVHEEYDPETMHNDLALVQLRTKITMSLTTQPISLNTLPILGNEELLFCGWGKLNPNDQLPNDLQYITLQSMPSVTCDIIHGSNGMHIDGKQLCTFNQINQGLCAGDPGSPLVYQGMLAGVASWYTGCAKGYPDVFTRISEYTHWISEKMK